MSPMVRGILIVVCVIALFYLATRFGGGLSDDPRMQPAPPVSDSPAEPTE